jgi:hypothetical protein
LALAQGDRHSKLLKVSGTRIAKSERVTNRQLG